jgi:hypothetical protein
MSRKCRSYSKDWKTLNIRRSGWWRTQSGQPGLHGQNSLLAGTLQGTFAIPRHLARKRPRQPTDIMSFLRRIPYSFEQGILFDELKPCREFKSRCRDLQTRNLHANPGVPSDRYSVDRLSFETDIALTTVDWLADAPHALEGRVDRRLAGRSRRVQSIDHAASVVSRVGPPRDDIRIAPERRVRWLERASMRRVPIDGDNSTMRPQARIAFSPINSRCGG